MNKENGEMNRCKSEVKACIEECINLNQLEKALDLIKEYEKSIKDDVDIFSMKSIVAIKENRIGDAQKILSDALEISNDNFDIIYNMAYTYELKGDVILAIKYYRRALEICDKSSEMRDVIFYSLNQLNGKLEEDIKGKITSIILLTYNNLEYTKLCIDSIRKYTNEGSYEIIIVDNASTDGTIEWLKEQKDIKVIFNDKNLGFPKGCNQGIDCAIGDNVLLLNNDTIVTPNWLKNLNIALYSSEDIGAVGSVTNSCSNYQTISFNYENTDDMIEFARRNNISNPIQWEERIRLVGFCMLIRSSVINKIGVLDEIFTPGNYEDDDYSYRIRKAGYKLILCKDSFIHHFGSVSFKKNNNEYNAILNVNRNKFKNKWGFDPSYSSFTRYEIINLIDEPIDKPIRVLEVGCACGATLLEIKNRYRNAEIYGIELNENAADIGKLIADIKAENIENENLNYEENYFDYIIFADVLEHLYDPWKVLNNIKKYLKEDGKILTSIPNVMHYSVIRNLLNGNWTYEDAGILDRTHVRFFTLNEIGKMFIEAGYEIKEINFTNIGASQEDIDFMESLGKICNNDVKNQYYAYQYIVRACKKNI
ncbi:glycosyltransferase [Clostridium hydrogenum]|uniref:glycosyltransferase n=1 Tax=Clostridium hydrogenum TaxID=2855764 RepID=UPI001F1B9BD8|nr:glycosyltransferase [Clostridium hydrogenum]